MSTPGKVTLVGLRMKSIKADLLSETVTITLSADLDDQMALARPQLQHFKTFEEDLDIQIKAQVTQLPISTFGPSDKDQFA